MFSAVLPHLRHTLVIHLLLKDPTVGPKKNQLNDYPDFHLLFSLLAPSFPSIQLGANQQDFESGPKPESVNITRNAWSAIYQEPFQSGIILMNFSRSEVWPENLQVQKSNL